MTEKKEIQPETKRLKRLFIRVAGEDGNPLPYVRIELSGEAGELFVAYTGSDGVAVLKDIPSGSYTLHAQMEGFGVFIQEGVNVFAGDNRNMSVILGDNSTKELSDLSYPPPTGVKGFAVTRGALMKEVAISDPFDVEYHIASADEIASIGEIDEPLPDEYHIASEDETASEDEIEVFSDDSDLIAIIDEINEPLPEEYHIPSEDKKKDYVEVPVFYGTNRKRKKDSKIGSRFGPQKAKRKKEDEISLGICKVSIPDDHTYGQLERPSTVFERLFGDNPKNHIVLLSVTSLEEETFYRQLHTHVNEVDRYKEGLIFIHGFNTTFAEAARRTAQLAFDLQIETPMMFSWPSLGSRSPLNYTRDGTSVEWAVPGLKKFIRDVSRRAGLSKLHLVAHSMGNRALTEALMEFNREANEDETLHFNEVILTAPDIDAEKFKRVIVPAITGGTKRVTLYASDRDKAMILSREMNGDPRAGDAGEDLVVTNGLDTIDVSLIKTGFFSHSYFCNNRLVMLDMYHLMRNSTPPERRNLVRIMTPEGHYWHFRP